MRAIRLREEYCKRAEGFEAGSLVFIDESSSNAAMTREYARSPQGERATGAKPFNWGENITMIGALDLTGLFTVMTVNGGTDGHVFRAFVEQMLVPELRQGDVVVLDNLSAHKVSGVREAIEAVGASVVYLPPYSPDLNPIENCWSKVKNYLRGCGATTRKAIDHAISEVMELVTGMDAYNWFGHCRYV